VVDAVIGQFEIDQAVTTAAFRAARERGAVTILNPAPGAPIAADLAAVSDWVIPNEHELAIIARATGTSDDPADDVALGQLARALGTRLLVTLGERGAALVGTAGHVRVIPAPEVEAVDTTGAGDAFVGAFGYAIASDWDEGRRRPAGVCHRRGIGAPSGTQASFPDDGSDAVPSSPRSQRGTTMRSESRLQRVFEPGSPVIAMVHLGALPGTPLHDRRARGGR